MKVGMFVTRKGRGETMRERTLCLFICSGCGEPILNLAEANFAPAEDNWDDLKRVPGHRSLELWADNLEVYHWKCDTGGVPWVNALTGLEAGFEYHNSISASGHVHLTSKE